MHAVQIIALNQKVLQDIQNLRNFPCIDLSQEAHERSLQRLPQGKYLSENLSDLLMLLNSIEKDL